MTGIYVPSHYLHINTYWHIWCTTHDHQTLNNKIWFKPSRINDLWHLREKNIRKFVFIIFMVDFFDVIQLMTTFFVHFFVKIWHFVCFLCSSYASIFSSGRKFHEKNSWNTRISFPTGVTIHAQKHHLKVKGHIWIRGKIKML